jgi:hypothetical protein
MYAKGGRKPSCKFALVRFSIARRLLVFWLGKKGRVDNCSMMILIESDCSTKRYLGGTMTRPSRAIVWPCEIDRSNISIYLYIDRQ